MLVPEQIVKNALDKIFAFIKTDFNNAATEEESYLYKVLGLNEDLKLSDAYEFYVQSKSLFVSPNDSPKAIQTKLFFNADKSKTPTIHIMASHDTPTPAGLGMNQGHELFDDDVSLSEMFTTAYQSQIPIVFTSENPSEVLLMYYFTRQILIPIMNHFEQKGMRNCTISGENINLQEYLMPGIFAKQLDLSYYNEVNSIDFYKLADLNGLNFIAIINNG